jgi:hypothetical protein
MLSDSDKIIWIGETLELGYLHLLNNHGPSSARETVILWASYGPDQGCSDFSRNRGRSRKCRPVQRVFFGIKIVLLPKKKNLKNYQ